MTHAGRYMDFLGACVMWALEYPKAIIYAGLEGSAAHAAVDCGRIALHQIVGGRMADPGVVAIGGQRGGVAVVVEVGETLLNKARRTKMRVAGRPHQRRRCGEVEGRNDARFAYWRERVMRLTAAREACAESIGLLLEVVYSLCRTSRMAVGERLWPFLGRTYK